MRTAEGAMRTAPCGHADSDEDSATSTPPSFRTLHERATGGAEGQQQRAHPAASAQAGRHLRVTSARAEVDSAKVVQLRAELHHQGLGSLSAQLHVERVARRRRAERQPGRAAVGLR